MIRFRSFIKDNLTTSVYNLGSVERNAAGEIDLDSRALLQNF